MNSALLLRRCSRAALLACTCAVPLPVLGTVETPESTSRARPESKIYLAQRRQCQRRIGPYATQDTAWRRWREARARGYAVSRGVVPCYDGHGTRGYCFFVFRPC